MQRIMKFVMHNWGYEMAINWVYNIMVAVHVGLGVAILAGGPTRFPFPTYQTLIDMVDGQTWIWGLWILISASFMVVPDRWPQIIGLWLGMCWQIMWAVAFAIDLFHYPSAGATEPIAYAGFAMLDSALLTARVADRDRG